MGSVVTCADSKKKNQGTKLLKKQSDAKRDKKKNQKAKFQKHNQEELIQPINKYKDILQKPVNYQEIIKILEDKISLQDIIKEGLKLPKHDSQIQNLAKLLYQEDYDYQEDDNLQKIKLKLSKLQQLYNKYCLWQEQQSVSNQMSKKLHFYLIYKRATLQLYKMKQNFDKVNFGKNLSFLEKQNKILEFLSFTYEKYFEENKENMIGDYGIKFLGELIENCPNLNYLEIYLRDNQLNYHDLKDLIKLCEEKFEQDPEFIFKINL